MRETKATAPDHVIPFTHGVDGLYSDAMALAYEMRACLSDRRALGWPKNGPGDGSLDAEKVYCVETMRISTRILHVIAWAMGRKAVAAGDLSAQQAKAPEWRLGDRALCLAHPDQVPDMQLFLLCQPFDGLWWRSDALYRRALRLQKMLLSDEAAHAAQAMPSAPRRSSPAVISLPF
ncbi:MULTISPECIES: DUF1465 family protein [unclassified Iodidimonas]|jgi:regulator of CtrA degradation|uniref:DUF1465 family protein n=1 Tax=unclassified Iodidimonas TaxID=2626145 RepID=UPI0024825809|nr:MULTISPECIES: DUF1465 family protein [unclassified Iodidimonas]